MNALDSPVLGRLLDPIGRILSPDVARKLLTWRFDRKTRTRIAQLARKCNEGTLTERQRAEYDAYVYAMDFIAILQAKARAVLKRSPAA